MKVLIEKYQRIFITLCLFLFFWIMGGFTLTLNLLYTGAFFLIAAGSMLWYLPFIWLLNKISNVDNWLHKEFWVAIILTGFLFLIGAIEAFTPHFNLSLQLMGGMLLIALLSYAYILINKKKEAGALHNEFASLALLPTGIMGMVLSIWAVVRYTYSTLPSRETEIVLFENSDPQMDNLALIFSLEFFLFIILAIYVIIKKRSISTKDNSRSFKLGIAGKIGAGMIFALIASIIAEYEPLIEFLLPFNFLLLIAYGIYWLVKQIKLIINLKNEQAKTELLHLKSQVNPHFFFNTLNNLYGLVEKDTKKARALILKLSDMMRYSIYEGQKDEVGLAAEMEYLRNYIELHQMRYHKQIKVDFNATIQEGDYKVMPLLFIILLENAFKHGVENLINNPFVEVNIRADADEIYFEVVNNFENSKDVVAQSGIGLKNLKRRLELVYQNRHTLSYSINNDVYKAQLSLRGIKR